ncbi:MAG: glycosyltransferase, partial [Chthoniobacterales bacterium]
MRVALDARYVREKPSGIGVYVQSLVDRLPEAAPADHFSFWAHRLAPRPLSRALNTSEVTVRPGPNSPWPLFWPGRYATFTDVDVFHSPHNLMPCAIPCASVVTVHDVMALEHPRLHLQGVERLVKSRYYQKAVLRALWRATRLIAPSKATANRICSIAPGAARRMEVILEAPDPCFRLPVDLSATRNQATTLIRSDAPYLLVVGANAPTKRHELALHAFAAAALPPAWRLV